LSNGEFEQNCNLRLNSKPEKKIESLQASGCPTTLCNKDEEKPKRSG